MIKIAHIHVPDKDNKGDHAIVIAAQEQIEKYLHPDEIIDISLLDLKTYNKDSLDKINSCDITIIGGGGILYGYFFPMDKNILDQITIPVIIYGVGYIEEFGSKGLTIEQKESIKILLEKSTLISVRDNVTKKFIEDLGVSKDVHVIGDPGLLLDETPPPTLPSGKLKVGLNINYSGWLEFNKYKESIFDAYRELATHLEKKYDAHIYYLVQHKSEHNIINELGIQNMQTIDFPAKEQKSFYRNMDIIIGMLLHSIVLGIGAETLAVNVAYDQRNLSFAEYIKSPEIIILPDQISGNILIKKVEEILSKKEYYLTHFKKTLATVQNEHKKYFKLIKNLA